MGLADAGIADDRQQLGRTRAGDALERRAQLGHLVGATDERPVQPSLDRRCLSVEGGQEEAAGHLGRAGGVTHQAPRRLVHPDLPAFARAREPLGRSDRPADHRPRRRDDLAGADAAAGPHAERQALGLGHELGGRAEGALHVVLLRHRRAEDDEDGVAAPLRRDATEARAGRSRHVVVALDDRPQGFGVEIGRLELREHARDQAPRVDGEIVPRPRRRVGRCRDALLQDRGLERPQLR